MPKNHAYILGINAYDHDVSACLLREGEIACAIKKERITRKKHATGFHRRSSTIASMRKGSHSTTSIWFPKCDVCPSSRSRSGCCIKTSRCTSTAGAHEGLKNALFGSKPLKVVTVSHHLAHAYSAFAASPFEEGVVMVVDGVGSYASDVPETGRLTKNVNPLARESESYYSFKGSRLEPLKKVWMGPNRGFLSDEFYNMPGLGAMYSRASTYVFGDWNKCGELMGLAPYGRPDGLEPLLQLSGGELSVPSWPAQFTQPWLEGDPESGRRAHPCALGGLAWRIQDDTERVLLARAEWLRQTTGAKNMCMAGGVALNCVANGRLARESGFDNVWIQPAAGDDGIAIGCAYYGYLEVQKKPRSYVMKHAFLGRPYGEGDVDKTMSAGLARFSTVRTASQNVCADTAKVLAEGKVIGWFQGRSEFGPRALGNRSILADPRTPEMKDILNKRVKFRQAFRPFAPIVLLERADEIFEGKGDSPYMLMAKRVAPKWRDKIPAIVHVDGSARVQTVSEDANPVLYRLLKEFEALTGVPVLINTSFNIKGQPIVETPADAMECFLMTGIDCLVLHDYLITKNAWHRVTAPVVKVYSDVSMIVRAEMGAK